MKKPTISLGSVAGLRAKLTIGVDMNNTELTQNVQPVTVAGISVRQDAEGRYCLNDLHKAAGGEKKNQPGHFTARKETADLAVELVKSRNPDSFVKPLSSTGGRYGGTYACKELVYTYAMWISPSFHLQVIRAYDEMYAPQTVEPVPEFSIPKTLGEALRLAADQQDQIEQQQRLIEHAKPAVEFMDRHVETRNTKSLRETAKILGLPEKAFIQAMIEDKILYRQSGNLLPHQKHHAAERFDVKTGERNGHAYTQTRVTSAGIGYLANFYGHWIGEVAA